MRRRLVLFGLVVSVLLCFSLVTSAKAVSMWNRTYGGESADTAQSLVEASDGGYAIAGTWNSSYSEDSWLVKTDSFGYMQWNKTYGGTGKDGAGTLIVVADGGYAMAGYTTSFGIGDYDSWLVKLDAFGNMEWNETYGGKDNDYASSLVATSDGGYALAGIWNYTTYYELGDGSAFPVLHGDFWLVKTDAYGNMQWSKTYGGTADDGAISLVATSDGGYAITGYTRSFGAGDSDFWLVKTDALGNMEWSKTYGGTSSDFPYSLIETSDGGYTLVGTTKSLGAGGFDFWLLKTDSLGYIEWSNTYGGTDNDMAHSLVATSDGGYAIAGQTLSFGSGDYDFWLVKTNEFGNMRWNKTYGGTAGDAAIALISSSDEGYALVGNTRSFGVGGDFWLVKTDELGIYPEYTSLLIPSLVLTATAFLLINKKRLLQNRSQEP